MKEAKNRLVFARITQREKDQLLTKVNEDGSTVSIVIRKLIEKLNNGTTNLKETK